MTETINPEIAEKIRASFARQGLMGQFDARIDMIQPGMVVLSLPITPAISQQHGFAHAGATFALGDSAAGYAALSLMSPEAEVLTVEMKINLMAPAAGNRLVATGRVIKAGLRLVVAQATVAAQDDEGRQRDVAMLQGTLIPA